MNPTPAPEIRPLWWLVRLPEVFQSYSADILGPHASGIGAGYWRVSAKSGAPPIAGDARIFARWILPVHHAWPCHPAETPGFIEKAAGAIASKFSPHAPRAVLAGALDPADQRGWFRKLASNLRGRTLQLMPHAANTTAETLAGDDPAVFTMVGRGGLFCGITTPRMANGFHPGGTRFIRQSGDAVISRAGAKIAEALHHVRLYRPPPPPGTRWLELGASPGGMTAELLGRGYAVTAIDRAPLDSTLRGAPGLVFTRDDAASWSPPRDAAFDAMLCDLNGPPTAAIATVARLAPALAPGALVVFTLKTPETEGFAAIIALHQRIVTAAAPAGLNHLHTTHLSYNRREFTLFFERRASSIS